MALLHSVSSSPSLSLSAWTGLRERKKLRVKSSQGILCRKQAKVEGSIPDVQAPDHLKFWPTQLLVLGDIVGFFHR